MTVLGEAFIEVRSDLKPFIRDLDREVKKAAENVEKQLQAAIKKGLGDFKGDGDKLGDELGDGVSRGFRRRMGEKGKPPWVNITAAFAAALDDGISALPTEVKAAIVGGIVLAVPFVSAALAGAVTAGLGAGLAGAGILIASQFQSVEDEAKFTGDMLRDIFTRAGQPFALQTVRALELVQDTFLSLEGRLSRIFDTASSFVTPLTRGLLDAIDFITESIDKIDDDLGPFVDELAAGFGTVGAAIGEAFEILASTGEDGRDGLRDLMFLISDIIIFVARLIAAFTTLYGWVRKIVETVPYLFPVLAFFIAESDKAATTTGNLAETNILYSEAVSEAVKATEAEEKALKEAARAMDQARDSAFGLIDATLDYEESIDRLSETLSENGKTFTKETDEGRANIRALGDAIKAAQADAEKRLASGKLNAVEAKALYQQEVDEILRIARAHGITEQAIQEVYGEAIKLVNIPDANTGWLSKIAAAASNAAGQLERAQRASQRIGGSNSARGGFQEYAEGGIVNTATQAIIGEAGPEVVIPLTKPARAAQLAQQSGLARMLTAAATLVQVFVGNEQLDARTVRIVEANNASLSNNLAFGARGI